MITAKNKSEILKNAWISFKAQNIKTSEMFGICLKNAWNTAKGLKSSLPSEVNKQICLMIAEKNESIKPIEIKPEIKLIKNLDFNQIYKDNYKYVCNVIRSKTDNKNDIDLIANDVFIQVNKVLSTIQIDKDIKPFLFQIAKNKVVDFYRSEFKHSYKTTDKVSDYTDEKGNEYKPTIAPKSYNANSVENQELSDKINNEISKLGSKANDILTMYYIDGLKYKEIAEVLNIPINSVGVFISRAKSVLHTNLKNDYQMIKEDYLSE